MRWFINDFELNNAANRVYLNEDITGLEIPTIRTSKGQRAGSHGGWMGKQLLDARAITLQGRIFSDSIAEALEKRRMIQRALPLYPAPVVVRIIDDDGAAYVIYCQVLDFKMPIGRFRGRSYFKIELEASDPRIYDDTAGAALTATIHKAVSGGLLYSPTSPVFGYNYYFTNTSPNSSIDNPSDLLVEPIIVIAGRTTNPVLINHETGELFEMTGYSVGEQSVTQIDMQQRTVRLGTIAQLVDGVLPPGVGSSVFGYVPTSAQWWGLVPDTNEIGFDSSGGSDVRQATLYWRPAYWGI